MAGTWGGWRSCLEEYSCVLRSVRWSAYNNNCWPSMKYKKQLRWLLFLLVPFVLLLCLHILIPLQIVSTGHALQNESYAVQTNNLSDRALQSLSITNSLALQSIIAKYAWAVRVINSFKSASWTFLDPLSTLSINSAFQYTNGNINNSSANDKPLQQSMWFATNCSQLQQLSSIQTRLYDSYAKKELMVRSLAEQAEGNPSYALSTLLVSGNESIVFEYPTRSSSDYSNLSSTVYMDLFSTPLNQMQQEGQPSSSTVTIRQMQQINGSLLVLCVGSTSQGVIEITCQQLNMEILMSELSGQMQMGAGLNLLSQTSLLLNAHSSSTAPQIIYSSQNKNKDTTAPSNTYLNTSILGLPSSLFTAHPSTLGDRLYVSVYNSALSFISGIAFDSINAFSLLTVSSNQRNGVQSVDLSSDLKALIIPVALLIVIGSIISAVVLKVLLDSLDKELYELEHRCQFIIDGDTNIEIPEYNGTKDIQELYRQVKIINKLHRYTISDYFRGHFAEKVLKYTECLQFLTKIGYDTGNILENIGQAMLHVEEWEKSIDYLKRSVELGLGELQSRFGLTPQQFLRLKVEKKAFPKGLKELEVVLRRRLFKLTFSNIKYVELRQTAGKTVSKAEEQSFKNKLEALIKEWTHYLQLLKIAFYPDFGGYSESIISLVFESKQHSNLKNTEVALKLLQKAIKYFNIYTETYSQVTKKLREKGSQFKLLHLKNRLTTHSRIHPETLKIMMSAYINRIKLALHTQPDKYYQAVNELASGVSAASITLPMNYLLLTDFRKMLIDLKIDPSAFQTTQVFKQACPFKTLHYGEYTKEIEPQLLRFPNKLSPGLEREYLVLSDCAKPRGGETEKAVEYFSERAEHIFTKHIKKTDRLSIMKFGVRNGIKIECKLTLKESNEEILRKELREAFREPKQARGSLQELVRAFCLAVNRLKALQSEKIILMFFRSISHYERLARKKRGTEESLRTRLKVEDSVDEGVSAEGFGEVVAEALLVEELRNCKVLFFCSLEDTLENFRTFFGLDQINRRIGGKHNKRNNLVFLIEEKHRGDVDRILMVKLHEVADNHVFIL